MIKKNHLKYLLPLSSLFFSLETFLGTILGYLFAKIYTEKIILKLGLPRSFFIPFFKNLRIKLHHWLSGILIILFGILFQIHILLEPFSLGCLIGVIWHDFQTDREWLKIVFRKNESN
jgi:hypothetical protein